MKILIVDDHSYNRDLLRFVLEDEGHECFDAEDGQQCIDFVKQDEELDLILMDVNMPVMDGIQATRQLRDDESIGRMLNIIFVTALDNPDVLVQCLDAGGNDFIPKPVNEDILISKVNAHSRIQQMYEELRIAHDRETLHRQLVDREHSIVEHVFNSFVSQGVSQCDNLSEHTSSMSMFNGDVVLSSPSPSGGVYVLIGDFTGHGLSAAIGSLPVMQIFNSYAQTQVSVGQMAMSMNTSLRNILPVGMFFCATLMHLDRQGTRLTYWAGGMSPALCVSPDKKIFKKLPTDHMPLGVLEDEEFDERVQLHDLPPGTRLYSYTDGVYEAKDANDEEFGDERVEALITSSNNVGDAMLQELVNTVSEFQVGDDQTDDVSLIELHCSPVVHREKATQELFNAGERYCAAECFPWVLQMKIAGDDLKKTDIVQQALSFLGAIQGVELHRDKLFTIVSELYSNALEHGVLGLDSSLKDSPEGFEEYYAQRQERLEHIENGEIEISLRYVRGTPNRIVLEITDSGKGFDYESVDYNIDENDERHGRGVHLLRSLCSNLYYSNQGRTVVAEYDFIPA